MLPHLIDSDGQTRSVFLRGSYVDVEVLPECFSPGEVLEILLGPVCYVPLGSVYVIPEFLIG